VSQRDVITTLLFAFGVFLNGTTFHKKTLII